MIDPAPWHTIDNIQHYAAVWRKMQIGGHHTKEFFTANAELTNAVLSEDGLTLRHNTVEPKQGDTTFGGMPVNDFNKFFIFSIEMQTDVKQNGVYGLNTTDDFHGTYREFHRLPYAEYDGYNRDPAAYQSTWCGINVVTDSGEYWQGQSLHSEDFVLDANGEYVMNVDWKRGSDAYWVLNPDNHDNGRWERIDVQHTLEGLDADIEYTEDKEKIILTGNQNIDEYHTGGAFLNDDVVIVRNCVGLPEGSDGFYTVKVLADGLEFTRLQQSGGNEFVNSSNLYEIREQIATNILNLHVNGKFYLISDENYIYKASRLPPLISGDVYPNFYIRNPVLSYVPPIKSGVIDLNQHIVANQFKLTHTIFQASFGCDMYLINNLAEKGLCVRMDELLQNQGYSSAGILNEKGLAANITIMVEADKRTSMNTRDNFNYDSVGMNNTINYQFVYRDGTPISDEDALAVGRITLHFNYDGFSILN